jgi:AraC family transcriptional regulator, ethanolamine operon transcriptional activator
MQNIPQTNTSIHTGGPCLARDIVTDDADCLARSISGWSQEYEQLKAGHFQGSLSELCFGDTQLFLEQTSHALRQLCTVPSDYVWFGLPLSEERSVRINGVPVKTGRIALHRGGKNFELVTPDALQFWGIVVKEELLMTYAHQFECEEWLRNVLDRPVLGVSEARKQAVQNICGQILLGPRKENDATLPAPIRQSLSDSTLSALFALFQDTEPVATDRRSAQQRHRLVERADAYVRSRRDHLVTVAELCSALNISRRALQIGFQDALGISPHAYMRTVSLNGVRSHLKNAESPYTCVQDAAAAYGFWHMSQFALDYRQLFGELPSATIKRRATSSLE